MQAVTERIIRHPFFAAMEEQFLPIVVLNANERIFAPGEIIFREGSRQISFTSLKAGASRLRRTNQ